MAQTTRNGPSLQGVEKGTRMPKPLGLRASNVATVAALKGSIVPKLTGPTGGIAVKTTVNREAGFNVYMDENGSGELNVVKQLERIQPPRVPLSVLVDDDDDEEPSTINPSSPIFESVGEGSEYFSVSDSHPFSAYDTPSDMIIDMLEYMRLREEKFMVKLRWEKQPELNENMRTVLVDWLHDVSVEYDMESETLHLAVSLIDRVLMKCSVSRSSVQLVGTAALMVASKYEQIHPPELKDFVYVTDDSYSENQILRMEQKMLNLLRFDVSVPTVEWFISHMLNMSSAPQKTTHLAHYLGDLSLLSSSLNGTPPSIIASSCIALSNLLTGPASWSIEMEERTSIRLSQMEAPMNTLLAAFNAAPNSEQRSVFEKYARDIHSQVSLLDAPLALPALS